nr:unnamed protein product [Spirometra erinaceieuropaei]
MYIRFAEGKLEAEKRRKKQCQNCHSSRKSPVAETIVWAEPPNAQVTCDHFHPSAHSHSTPHSSTKARWSDVEDILEVTPLPKEKTAATTPSHASPHSLSAPHSSTKPRWSDVEDILEVTQLPMEEMAATTPSHTSAISPYDPYSLTKASSFDAHGLLEVRHTPLHLTTDTSHSQPPPYFRHGLTSSINVLCCGLVDLPEDRYFVTLMYFLSPISRSPHAPSNICTPSNPPSRSPANAVICGDESTSESDSFFPIPTQSCSLPFSSFSTSTSIDFPDDASIASRSHFIHLQPAHVSHHVRPP